MDWMSHWLVGGWIFCHKYNLGDGVELKRSDHSRLTSWSEGEILACICISLYFWLLSSVTMKLVLTQLLVSLKMASQGFPVWATWTSVKAEVFGGRPSPASAGHTFDEGGGVWRAPVPRGRAAEIILTDVPPLEPQDHTQLSPLLSTQPLESQNHNMWRDLSRSWAVTFAIRSIWSQSG